MRRHCQIQTRNTCSRLWAAGVVALAMLIGSGRPAGAQIEIRTFYLGHSPTVARDDIDALKHTFELDEAQEELIAAVYEGYRAAYNASSDATRDNLQRLRDSMSKAENPGLRATLQAEHDRVQEEWGRQSAALETGFFDDVKELLTQEQAARWPRYERDRRRRAGLLLSARLMAERVDLVALLDSLELADEVRAACDPVVEQYTLDFDTPLTARLRLADQMETLSYQSGDKAGDAQMQSLQERLIRLHVEIRDINLQYVERIAEQLPMEDARRFRDAFQQQVWPRIFGANEVAIDVERVRRLAALTPGQDQAVSALVSSYESRVEPINRELVQVEMRREMARLSPPVSQGTGPAVPGGAGEGGPGALEERAQGLLESRRALIQTTLADIRTVLTAEQLRTLTRESSFGGEDDHRQ